MLKKIAVVTFIFCAGLALCGRFYTAGQIVACAMPQRESLTYLFGGTGAGYIANINKTQNSLNGVMPDWFEIDDSGNLIILNKLDTAFVTNMHGRGVQVVPFISNHWDRSLGLAALANRVVLAQQIAQACVQYNLDGINVDIENLQPSSAQDYVDFMHLLKEAMPHKIVSTAVAANPNGWRTGWHGSYNYGALAAACDYLVIMAYDESYGGSPAGPVSSRSFFDRSIEFALNEGVPPQQVVVAIPFYGRYWKQGETGGGSGIAAADVKFLQQNYECVMQFFDDLQSACVVVTIKPSDTKPTVWGGRVLEAGVYEIWYDSEQATYYKLNAINKYGLAGAASWALGQENTGIWDFYAEALNGSSDEYELLPPALSEPAPLFADELQDNRWLYILITTGGIITAFVLYFILTKRRKPIK